MNVAALALSLTLSTIPALAQQPGMPATQSTPARFTQADLQRIIPEVRKRLASLPDYAVFDYLYFGIKGRELILQGFASRPLLQKEAASALTAHGGIEGVERVDNQIKVLPYSPNDDRIRLEIFRRIYGFPTLRKYTGNPVGFDLQPSLARAAGGITQDPPLGFHAIHIIVDAGHVTLYGVVDSKEDAETATLQANTAPGAFSVADDLDYPGKQGQAQK